MHGHSISNPCRPSHPVTHRIPFKCCQPRPRHHSITTKPPPSSESYHLLSFAHDHPQLVPLHCLRHRSRRSNAIAARCSMIDNAITDRAPQAIHYQSSTKALGHHHLLKSRPPHRCLNHRSFAANVDIGAVHHYLASHWSCCQEPPLLHLPPHEARTTLLLPPSPSYSWPICHHRRCQSKPSSHSQHSPLATIFPLNQVIHHYSHPLFAPKSPTKPRHPSFFFTTSSFPLCHAILLQTFHCAMLSPCSIDIRHDPSHSQSNPHCSFLLPGPNSQPISSPSTTS